MGMLRLWRDISSLGARRGTVLSGAAGFRDTARLMTEKRQTIVTPNSAVT